MCLSLCIQSLTKPLRYVTKANYSPSCFLLLFFRCLGQNIAPVVEWQRCNSTISADKVSRIIPTQDSGYIYIGNTYASDSSVGGSVNHGNLDIWVVKMSASKVVEWQRLLGGNGNDWASSIVQTSDGGYVIGGTTNSDNGDVSGRHGSFNQSSTDCWILKLSAQGNLLWQKCIGGSAPDILKTVIKTADNGFLMAGTTSSIDGDLITTHGNLDYDAFVVKLSSTGNIEWTKCYGGSAYEEFISGCQTSDGGYIFVGGSYSHNGDVSGNHSDIIGADAWVVKISALGVIQWSRCYGGLYGENPVSIIQTRDGGYAFLSDAYQRQF